MFFWNSLAFLMIQWTTPALSPRVHLGLCPSPRDAASRRALQAAIQQLAEAQPEATAKNLLHSLQSSGIGSKVGVPR